MPSQIFTSADNASVRRDLIARCCHRAKTYQRNQIRQNRASPVPRPYSTYGTRVFVTTHASRMRAAIVPTNSASPKVVRS